MPIATINDISMYYEQHGTGEPLILIGGFGVDHTVWTSVIERFKPHYQVIVFDNRGIGQSEVPPGPYSIEQMADDVEALCTYLGIKQSHFVGSSMGGCILQTLAFKYPALVKSAVIGNAPAQLKTSFHIHLQAQLELLKANAPKAPLIKDTCSWVFSCQFLSQPGMLDGLIELNLANPYPFTVPGYEGQYAALCQFDSSAWISHIQAPTLVLAADEDLIFSAASVKALAAKIPHASYYCFNACGHVPSVEYPEQFSQVVLAFINGL